MIHVARTIEGMPVKFYKFDGVKFRPEDVVDIFTNAILIDTTLATDGYI